MAVLRPEPVWLGLTFTAWLKIFIVAALMVWLFYVPCLRRLWQKTNPFTGEANWSHSIFVPIVGLYYLYINREELLTRKVVPLLGGDFTKARFISGGVVLLAAIAAYFAVPLVIAGNMGEYLTSAAMGVGAMGLLAIIFDWGIGTLLFGLLTFGGGIYPIQNDWLKDLGMVVTLFGVVLTLCGWDVMKIAWFPIVFLICALPWPELVYSAIAGPLQHLAASVAVGVLNICGATSDQIGTKIVIQRPMMSPRVLNVAEACAGLRSLMTFISVGAMLAFLSSRALWQKIIMTLSAIPIAIFCNVMRVAGQGLLDRYVSEKLSESFAHQFVGMVMLVPGFFLLLAVGWMLDQLFIEEVDESEPEPAETRTAKPHRPSEPSLAGAPRRPALGPRVEGQ